MLGQSIEVAHRKASVILDGTVPRIDRVGVNAGRDRRRYSGKHKCHGVNVQVIADPRGGRPGPRLPAARHDIGTAREHGIIDALSAVKINAVAHTAYQEAAGDDPGSAPAPPPRSRQRPLLSALALLP